jgi:hypothetical protein
VQYLCYNLIYNQAIMKILFTALLGIFFMQPLCAQKITKVSLSGNGQFERVTFEIGESVVLHLSKEGQIIKWGVDIYGSRDDNYRDRLEEYTGKTGYYGPAVDSAFRGKIQFIGQTYITYYPSYENILLQGKIKSIGNVPVDYYLAYENVAYRGYIKNMGSTLYTWYSSFDNEGLRGKLKSLGTTPLTYYSSFEDVAFRGKLKLIDRTSFTYYSSFDRPEFRGGIKTGAQVVMANGIKFYTRW